MNSDYTSGSLFDIRGRKALVAGGSKGLGREMALCLIENGCDVFVVSRSAAPEAEVLEKAQQYGVSVYYYACDVLRTEAVREMVAAAENAMGRIDILINSAGRNIRRMVAEMDDASWDAVLDVNLRASFIIMREVIKVMRKQQYGKIVNMSSMKSVFGVSDDGYTAYCASKGAINMLTKQVACEVAADHITVNALAPTFIETAINRQQLQDPVFYQGLVSRIPTGRIGQFRDLMGLLLLLVSDASEFLTGQIYLIDGGISARQ